MTIEKPDCKIVSHQTVSGSYRRRTNMWRRQEFIKNVSKRLAQGRRQGGQGGDRPPNGFKKEKNMGYFHALKLAFLSSLIRKYMLWEGFYHDFSTKKVSASGGFALWPPPRAPPPGPPPGGAAPWTPEITSPPLTISVKPQHSALMSLRADFICSWQHIHAKSHRTVRHQNDARFSPLSLIRYFVKLLHQQKLIQPTVKAMFIKLRSLC